MYKTFAKHLLAIAFVIYLIAAIITALLALAGGTIGILLGSFVAVVAAFVLQATLVKAVQDIRDGQADLSIGQTVSDALPYLASVAGASILAGLAITIGLVLLIVPGLFLITIWAVIVPVIIIERSGALASFRRSRELVRGRSLPDAVTAAGAAQVLVWPLPRLACAGAPAAGFFTVLPPLPATATPATATTPRAAAPMAARIRKVLRSVPGARPVAAATRRGSSPTRTSSVSASPPTRLPCAGSSRPTGFSKTTPIC